MEYLIENTKRNDQILSDLIENQQHFNLILSDRLLHLQQIMAAMPPEVRQYAVMIDGKMTSKKAKADRVRAIEEMRSGEKSFSVCFI